jgi:CheY-like chemotaxis protein
VLIVDDDTRLRSVLRAALEENALVLEAADGDQAFEILEKRARGNLDLDLMLVDYVLPRRPEHSAGHKAKN